MEINHAAVIGSGQMGNGIAHVFAAAGSDVVLIDVRKELLDKAVATIRKNMERQVAKNMLTQDVMEKALKRIRTGLTLEEAQPSQIVIEAVTENMKVKKDVFARLDRICPQTTILATNTSSLSITMLGEATRRAPKVIGMHFMNPVPVMKLVEIIRGRETSDETFETVRRLAVKLGKEPVTSKDSPGFISNRVLMPMINEACYALMEGVATKEDIDTVMRLGMNHPMGPLALADHIGLDTCISILEVLHQGFRNPKYQPCPLLHKMVEEGRLGRKSGRGFYEY